MNSTPKPLAAPVSLGNILAKDMLSTQGVLQLFQIRETGGITEDPYVCLRLQNCNPAKALGSNFPRIANAYGVAMYRGIFCLAHIDQVHNMCKFIYSLDCLITGSGRRPRVVVFSMAFLREKLGDSMDNLIEQAMPA